ncbi:MAG: (p)ppGpp synthetase [Firmicutes bacterium GWF2_51_9]|nr:MAG: (p)ppGpp synthetase [Firmicutes bacterium GWF2_51_9]OGS58071.1 MAG: (p)ppGpp synthetase [Firmicutes bacterium GWE2_51_13]HAM62602.1 (p)ppGpp synthetase [Erysipelotrichaceae bacterium]HBZ41287.1 (p)ppGpp synthetase [Erysipelotrichaceae bacterium]
MESKKQLITMDDVRSEVRLYIQNTDSLALIDKAFTYAELHHKEQFRKSGEPYIIHLVNVAYILATLRVGPRTVTAGLLHDVIEDCGISKDRLAKDFDDEVATLVESVTKIGNIEFKDEKEYQAVNHRKIFIAMAKDVRVILIKLVDRLHNMRTLQYMTEEKQMKIAGETLEVYAPIAHRLGISEIKNELEDLSFYYLHRDKYYEIAHLVEMRKAERDAQVNTMIEDISEMLGQQKIPFRIFGRSKHLYSIYKKMTTKNKRFDEILDLLAIRIVTQTEVNCYEVLGYIHQKYRPIPGRLKDYIAMPKMNMYQSLHTTIIGEGGAIFEVQIRTENMDAIAEQGVAAHWRYKEGNKYNPEKEQHEIEEKLAWFKDFTTMTDDVHAAGEYMDLLTHDVFEANVYVMSPKGRVIDLPQGSTPIDFAYRIHTDIGHATVGAIVNGILVPINTELKTGDVVQIKTSKQSNGPSEDWLKFVKTSHARNKIRNFLQKKELEDRSENIAKGESMFREELKRRGMDEKEFMNPKKLETVFQYFTIQNYNDFMNAIAVKSLSMTAVFEKLQVRKPTLLENFDRLFKQPRPDKKNVSKFGVTVAGVDSIMISLAGCCNPVFGDEIIGYITKGQGVKVHRKDCPNVIHETRRLIHCEWDDEYTTGKYEVNLFIMATDRSFLITDIITVVSQCKAGLSAINSTVNDDKITATTTLKVIVDNAEHLRIVIANLKKVNSVLTVDRMTQ